MGRPHQSTLPPQCLHPHGQSTPINPTIPNVPIHMARPYQSARLTIYQSPSTWSDHTNQPHHSQCHHPHGGRPHHSAPTPPPSHPHGQTTPNNPTSPNVIIHWRQASPVTSTTPTCPHPHQSRTTHPLRYPFCLEGERPYCLLQQRRAHAGGVGQQLLLYAFRRRLLFSNSSTHYPTQHPHEAQALTNPTTLLQQQHTTSSPDQGRPLPALLPLLLQCAPELSRWPTTSDLSPT